MLLLILVTIGILLASGLCSMTEAAILSLPFIRARIMEEEKEKGARDLLFVKENVHSAVATIVILNNTINIVGAVFVGQMVARLFGNQYLGVFSAVLAFGIIIIAEVIPKTIGEQYKARVSLASAKILRILMWLFTPVVVAISFLMGPFRKRGKRPWVTEKEIKLLLRIGRTAGTVELDEETLINRVFKLNDVQASQIMKPIENIYALDANKTLLEAKELIVNSNYSRIAVYDKNPSDIVGIVQQRMLLKEIANDNYNVRIKNFISKPVFVDQDEKADTLLEKFRSYHRHLFIIRDKKKRSVGIVSMEDVLEELFGKVQDEKS